MTNSENDHMKLRNWLLGGAMVGGSTGALTSLINHFSTLKRKADQANDTSFDDDTLYVNLPKEKQQQKLAGELNTALGITGGAAATLGSYALVQKLYQKHKRKMLQKELDDAQNAYLDTMSPPEPEEMQKGAFELFAAPLAVGLTGGLGAAVLTHKILDKQFPAPKRTQSLRPRRLVIRETPDPEDDKKKKSELPDEMVKQQSYEAQDHDLEHEAHEHLVRTVLALPEVAEASELGDLVKAAGAGHIEGLLSAGDINATFAFAKKAGENAKVSPLQRDLAIAWLVRDPELSPAVKLAAAAEFANACPLLFHLAREIEPQDEEHYVKIAGYSCRYQRTTRYEGQLDSKRASVMTKSAIELLDGLRTALELSNSKDPEVNLTGGTSEDSDENQDPALATANPVQIKAQGPRAQSMVEQNRDVIDDILQPKPSAPTPAV